MQQLLASDVLADGRSECCFSVVSELAERGARLIGSHVPGQTPVQRPILSLFLTSIIVRHVAMITSESR